MKFSQNFLTILFLVFSSSNLWAQSSSEMEKQLEEIMKAREEMFKMLMDDSSFDSFDKRFENMVKKFQQAGGFGLEQSDDPIVGEYDWLKTPTHKILKLKVKQVKDKPLDIKIENGMIRLKGDVETIDGEGQNTVKRKVSFQRAFSLPDDVDQTNPEFENKEGSLLIKFKLKKVGTSSGKAHSPKVDSTKQEPATDRVPVVPSGDDVTI
jgi:HSP20 family molecular chaperone IbpA